MEEAEYTAIMDQPPRFLTALSVQIRARMCGAEGAALNAACPLQQLTLVLYTAILRHQVEELHAEMHQR